MTLLLAAGGGLLAGVLHVLLGPDHLAAVLPFAVSRPRGSVRVGLYWGLGHGLGVLCLGAVVLLARSVIDVDAVSASAEVLVGFLLVGVGLWALRRSRRVVLHSHRHPHDDSAHAHPHIHLDARKSDAATHALEDHGHHHHSTLGFGVIHGLAGMGHLVAASPLVALSHSAAAAYLIAYLGGGMVAMTLFAAAAAQLVRRPSWVPVSLAATGALSVGVGVLWVSTFLSA